MKEFNLAVERHMDKILEAERFLWQHPETGYKEFEASNYLADVFKKLGYDLVMAEGIPGFYTVLDTKKPGPEIMILAEMDAVVCPKHPESNPKTGAVHGCGHHAQCAALIGIAAALKEEEVFSKLCGKIRLCAVPAEELLELEYRNQLIKEGRIKYFSGKCEFLSRGYFDGVDLAFMVHASSMFMVNKGMIGCITKQVIYRGIASHAGGSPWDGKNALYAANCGLNAINAIRETFKDDEKIRVHPIITNGGAMVNAIPETTVLESFVRGASFDAICNVNHRVNQALCGAALSLGTNIEIIDTPGYAPLVNDDNLIQIVLEAKQLTIPEYEFIIYDSVASGSTDMGDLSLVMPVVHAYSGGAVGKPHGSDYEIKDPVAACVASAKLQLGMLGILLSDSGKKANKILEEFNPSFPSKEEYFSFLDRLNQAGDRIEYNGDNIAIIKV